MSPSSEEQRPSERTATPAPEAASTTKKSTADKKPSATAKKAPAAKKAGTTKGAAAKGASAKTSGAGTKASAARTRRPSGPAAELLAQIDRVVDGHHHDPHSVLGVHTEGRSTVVRALRPGALEVHAVLGDGTRVELAHLHRGVFAGKAAKKALGTPAELRVAARYEEGGAEHVSADPYVFAPTLGDRKSVV